MGVLLMLMTIGGIFLAAILLFAAHKMQKLWLRNFVLGGVAVWFVFYIVMLLGFSFSSEEKLLGLNEPKEFCGFYLDCHMHAAVINVRKTKTIGDETAVGDFYIVKIKVFSNAKKATLGFDSLKLFVIDENGRAFPRATDLENPEPPFTQPVPAGGSFEKEVVFDLPTNVKGARLDMHDGKGLIEKVLIGDEDSIFHKRNYFKLEEQNSLLSVK